MAERITMIHAAEWNEKGDGLGPVSIARIERAYKVNGLKFGKFLATAGSLAPATKVFQCALMQEWLGRQHRLWGRYMIVPENPTADNSIAEVISARVIIQERGLWEAELYVCSSWWHIPRLLLIWRKYGYGLKPKLILAGGPTKVSYLAREFAAIIQLLFGKAGPKYID